MKDAVSHPAEDQLIAYDESWGSLQTQLGGLACVPREKLGVLLFMARDVGVDLCAVEAGCLEGFKDCRLRVQGL